MEVTPAAITGGTRALSEATIGGNSITGGTRALLGAIIVGNWRG
jgi:hypothetical protein